MRLGRRDFNKLFGSVPLSGFLGLIGSFAGGLTPTNGASPGANDAVDSRPWYETKRLWVNFNAHLQDWDPVLASRLDAREIMRNVLASRGNVFVMFAVDSFGNAYYPTTVGHKHRNLHNTDLLKEIIAECKRNGIAAVLYHSLAWNKYAALRHPDWVMKDVQGRAIGYDGLLGPFLCPNSAGYLAYVKAIAAELVQYESDGLFYDTLSFTESGTTCYCEANCQPLFRQNYGTDMPRSASWDEAWRNFLEFRYESMARFDRELTAHVRQLRPAMSVGYNYIAQPFYSWKSGEKPVEHRLLSDYGFAESLPQWGGQWYPSLLATFVRCLKPGTASLMWSSRCVGGYATYTMRPEADLKWEAFTYLAHGTSVAIIDDVLQDGSLQPQYYELMGRIFDEAKQKDAYFGQEHVRDVGLYYSLKSRDWYGREKPERYENAFIGAHRALTEAHIPVDVLFDESVTMGQLEQYPVVYLPNTAILDESEVKLFREYVHKGGKLLATLETGLYDNEGKPAAEFQLTDMFGVRHKAPAEFSVHYYRLPPGGLTSDTFADWDVLVPGPAHIFELAGAQALGELRIPFYDGPPFHAVEFGGHNPPWKRAGAAVFLNRYGEGQTAYVPFGVDAAYVGEYPLPEHRIVLRNLIRHLNPKPPIRLEAPLAVETVVTEIQAERRYIIHFIGYQSTRVIGGKNWPIRPNLMEEPLLYRARIQMDQPPRQVSALSAKTKIARQGTTITLQIEDIHEVVTVSR